MDKFSLIRELAKVMREEELSLVEFSEAQFSIKLGREVKETTKGKADDRCTDTCKVFDVRSPLAGVFLASLDANDKPLTYVGRIVEDGDVLCFIQAGKEINEITTDTAGEVVEIATHEGQTIGQNQIMFKIRSLS